MRTPKRFKKRRKTLKENQEFLNSLDDENTNVTYIEIDKTNFTKPNWWRKLDEIFEIK